MLFGNKFGNKMNKTVGLSSHLQTLKSLIKL